jgi:hypothetical protein
MAGRDEGRGPFTTIRRSEWLEPLAMASIVRIALASTAESSIIQVWKGVFSLMTHVSCLTMSSFTAPWCGKSFGVETDDACVLLNHVLLKMAGMERLSIMGSIAGSAVRRARCW